MIRTKTANNYRKIIEVYKYYIDRENVDLSRVKEFSRDLSFEYSDKSHVTFWRSLNIFRLKKSIGKNSIHNQNLMLEIYKKKLDESKRN